MYRRVLIPLDGSKLAEAVFTQAEDVAGRLDLDVVLLHVYRGDDQSLTEHQSYIERAAEVVKSGMQDIQQKTGAQLHRPVQVQAELAEGYPAEEILRVADENQIDLILMATHGRSGIGRWALGSVADKVVSMSKVPVWLIRAGSPQVDIHDEPKVRSILVPLDGSELAETVLPHVEALAKQRGIEVDVVLLQVCEPLVILADYPVGIMPSDWEEHKRAQRDEAKRDAEEYLALVEKQLRDKGLKVQSEVLLGGVAEEIINYGSKYSFYLIAMSTHGRTGLTRWYFGSVADKVLHGASCPLFLVRPR